MRIPPLKIDDLEARIPIIQGGMGVGISLSGLASAVAKEGGIGVIAAGRMEANPDPENRFPSRRDRPGPYSAQSNSCYLSVLSLSL